MISKPVKQSKIPIPVAPVSRRKWVISKNENCKKCMTQGADILNIAAEYEELTIGCRKQLQHLTESVEFVDWERALEVAEKNGLIEMWRQRSVELEIRLAQMERDAVIERDGHLERTQQVERLHEEKTNQLEARILQLESELGEALERSIMDVQKKLENYSDDDFDDSSDDQTIIEVVRGTPAVSPDPAAIDQFAVSPPVLNLPPKTKNPKAKEPKAKRTNTEYSPEDLVHMVAYALWEHESEEERNWETYRLDYKVPRTKEALAKRFKRLFDNRGYGLKKLAIPEKEKKKLMATFA
ncbi:unnamed protein product [Caenorhabditis brenneri]